MGNLKSVSGRQNLHKHAIWSGYNQSYVKNIISGGMKALKLLATLTFDPGLLFWVKGLENHLKNKMREAELEALEVEKYRF